MTGKRRKERGVKVIGYVILTFLLMGFVTSLLPPCLGMDALTQTEMGALAGQQGISIGFGSGMTVRATFNSMSFGDSDGWGATTGQDETAGWIVLIGNGSNTGLLSISIPEGSVLDISVGTTGSAACSPGEFGGIQIPPYTSFFSFSLTKFTLDLQTPLSGTRPAAINIMTTSNPSTGPGSMDLVGKIYPKNVMIEKADMKSTAYVWAHN